MGLWDEASPSIERAWISDMMRAALHYTFDLSHNGGFPAVWRVLSESEVVYVETVFGCCLDGNLRFHRSKKQG